jgi:hypothetical protein
MRSPKFYHMELTKQQCQVRNLALAIVNGSVTLIILLIAPLGLAAVIANTLMVTVSTWVVATACDRVILYLQPKVLPPTDAEIVKPFRTKNQLKQRP